MERIGKHILADHGGSPGGGIDGDKLWLDQRVIPEKTGKTRETMKSMFIRNVMFTLLIYGAIFGSMPLLAADRPAKQSGGETTVSEKDLTAFVRAYVDYQKIRSSYGPALESAKDPQEKQRLEREANTKVKQSLDAAGLTSARYNEIFNAVNGNEGLRKKVLKKIEDERRRS